MRKKLLLYTLFTAMLCACTPHFRLQEMKTAKNLRIAHHIAPSPSAEKLIEPYKKGLEKEMNLKIAYTPIELTKTGQNSHLGNLLADFTYEKAHEWAKNLPSKGIDAALINIGGIRNSIPKGDILVKHIYEVMPFENELVIVKINGNDVQKLFKHFEKSQKNDPVSHLYIETMDKKLVKGLINGQEVDPNRNYLIATSDYLALGGDGMDFFQKGEILHTGIKLRNVFLEKMKQKQTLSFGEVEQRLRFLHTSKQ